MSEISATTTMFALIGNPTGHSLSPALHNASFRALGIDARYVCHDVAAKDVGAAVAGLKAIGYGGVNVTMPHKAAVIPFLDDLSEGAELMGAVNTIKFDSQRGALGYNTDGRGVINAVQAHTPVEGATMTIIGAGGSGSAILVEAVLDGVAKVNLFNRRSEKFESGQSLAARLATVAPTEINVIDLADSTELERSVRESSIVVDATAVGMGKLEEQSNVDAGWISRDHVVVETIYHPRVTKLIQYATDAGAKTVDGLDMLLGQAAISEKIWLGVEMPLDVTRAAVGA